MGPINLSHGSKTVINVPNMKNTYIRETINPQIK